MDVNLWGKLYFVSDKQEGDYSFGDIKIWVESFLNDSINMYNTSSRETFNILDNDNLYKLDFYNHFIGEEDKEEKTVEVYDFKSMKKKVYRLEEVEESDITLKDIDVDDLDDLEPLLKNEEDVYLEDMPLGPKLKTVIFEDSKNDNGLKETKIELRFTPDDFEFEYLSGVEYETEQCISKWTLDHSKEYVVLRYEAIYYKDHVDVSLYCVNLDEYNMAVIMSDNDEAF